MILDRLRSGLSKTRAVLEMPVSDLLQGRRPLDPEALRDHLEGRQTIAL